MTPAAPRKAKPRGPCGAVHRGLVCTRKAGHGGKLHVARGLGNRFLRVWPVAPRSK